MKKPVKKIAVIDCETDPFGWNKSSFSDNEVHPFVWGFYDLESATYKEFWNDELNEYGDYSGTCKLIEFLQDEDYLIYAHNGGKFDFMFLLPWFDQEIMLVNGRIAKATIGGCEFRDSFMILPVPLSAMEKESDFDYDKKMHFKNRHRYTSEISDYLRSDCVNLGNWVRKFVEKYGTKLTLASVSMGEIKKAGIEVPIHLNRQFIFDQVSKESVSYDSYFRQFYFGGRTQCFQKGEFEGPLDYYDINSAYPFAMLHKHPIGYTRTQFRGKLPASRDCVFFATIRAISRGCLPVRTDENKLDYPDDNVERIYHTTCWEIWIGLDTGTLDIIEVIDGWRFIDIGDFSKFIMPYYAAKNASEKGSPEYLFSKLIMNAGYGKFGMAVDRFREYNLTPFCHHPMGGVPIPGNKNDYIKWKNEFDSWSLYAEFFEYSVWEKPNPGERYNNVCTAASITGFVRAYLWWHICKSEFPIYCDTDSLICKKFNGKIGEQLGEWSCEGRIKRAYIAQRKMYCLEMDKNPWKATIDNPKKSTTRVILEFKPVFKVASKGVRLSPDEIIKGVQNGGQVTFQKTSPAFSVKYGQRFLKKTIDFDV